MPVCVPATTAANLRYRGLPPAQLEPVKLSDGRYAVGESTLTDRRFAEQRPLLATGSIESAAGLTFTDDTVIHLTIDSKPVYLMAANKPHAFAIPAPNVYRFEARVHEFGWVNDKAHDNRHLELISEGDTFGAGETLWSSFSFVVGPQHATFDVGGTEGQIPAHNLIHQWHSVDVEAGRAPVLGVDLLEGNFEVFTRSDADLSGDYNGKIVRYSVSRPTDGAVHNIVISGLLGSSGHLNVWLNGAQVINVDCPIGYYNDDGGTRDLAYPHWGIYQKNFDDPAIVYHANIEWGLSDLSARIASPLSVPTPPGGWV